MDRVIERKKGIRKKHLPYIAGGILLVVILWMVFSGRSNTLRTDSRSLTIGEALYGDFNDYIRITGQVQPVSIIQLAPLEGGIVDSLFFEEGAMVKKGDVIVRLSNPNLNLSIMDGEAQLAEKQNFLRNTQVTMEQEKLSIRQERLQMELDITRARRKYEQNKSLYDEKLIAHEEYLQAKEDYELSVNRYDLIMERQRQDSIYRSVQVEQMQESLNSMLRNMILTRQREANLDVRSPIDGELGLLDVVLGQSVAMGQKIGQVNDLSDYMIEAQINEHYIDKVRGGLDASFERQGALFPLRVRKIYPEVREGKFRTDLVFTAERPGNIRSGQTYYIDLQLGQPAKAVMIPRGSFYQATGGKWIYVLSPEGDKAYKRRIKIGRQNPQYYEVTEGLKAGERVITSAYDGFGDNEILLLN